MRAARRVAETYTSFWSQVLPTGDRHIRNINLQLERFAPPLTSSIAPNRRSFVNELGFRLFSASPKTGRAFSAPQLEKVIRDTMKYISRFRDSSGRYKRPGQTEIDEALKLRGALACIL